MPPIAIVVPCYNEAHRLDVRAFRKFIQNRPDTGFHFVNDGSADQTEEILTKLQRHQPASFFVQNLSPNRGKAEAVRQGMLSAFRRKPLYAGYWDADLATPLSAIPSFCGLLDRQSELHLVMGSRVALLGRRVRRRWRRHLAGRLFATAASITLRLPVYDTQCGAKLFRVSPAIEEVFSQPFCSRWIFDVEILARLSHQHLSGKLPPPEQFIYETPLDQWTDVSGSKLTVFQMAGAARDLVRIARRYSQRDWGFRPQLAGAQGPNHAPRKAA